MAADDPTATAGRPGAMAAPRSTAAAAVRGMRPTQWLKNGVVFAALVFGHELTEPASVARVAWAAAVFCLLGSAMYLLNDVHDADRDRLHPVKRLRPVASGALSHGTATGAAVALLAAGLIAALALGPAFAAVALAYVGLTLAYTHGLKRLVIVDVMAIAAGFVLRAVAGAVAIDVRISPWLLICTALLALLLGFGKRRHELATLPDAVAHRQNLQAYTLPLLDQLVTIVAAATLIAYAIYAVDAPLESGRSAMLATTPFVAFAVFRYLYLIHARGEGGSPEALLLHDVPLAAAIALWAAVCVVLLYTGV